MPTPHSASNNASDLEKLLSAFSAFSSIHSLDDILALFGLRDLPTRHKYGLYAGVVTFGLTITTVFILLVKGGTFQRLAEQSSTGEPTIPSVTEARIGRALIMERLLECRELLMKNYVNKNTTSVPSSSILTQVLVNVAPDMAKARSIMDTYGEPEEDETKKKLAEELNQCLPTGYATNYVEAYRVCQDKPGGT